MKVEYTTLSSPLHDAAAIESATGPLIEPIRAALAPTHDLIRVAPDAPASTGSLRLWHIATGGTEAEAARRLAGVEGPVCLLTGEGNNALPASLEIAAWLRERGLAAEILHGAAERTARRIDALARARGARQALDGMRMGVIGKPSDWLIGSEADPDALRRRLGIDLIEIPMEELLAETRCARVDERLLEALGRKGDPARLNDALRVYTALRVMARRHLLSALTVRCFDLLGPLRTTGCLALALLGRDGLVAGCEGDVPALVSMMVLTALTGRSAFQANPSIVDPERGRVTLAHCTVPLDLIDDYRLDTHFESGIGVGIAGRFGEGDATLFKMSGDAGRYFVSDARIVPLETRTTLCRTQVTVVPERGVDYFLREAIGNHHILTTGRWSEGVDALFAQLPR